MLVNYYAKNLDPVESFKGALIRGGIVGTLMQNPRHIAHPFNAVRMLLGKTDVKQMFKDFKTNKELWTKNHWVLEEAYSQCIGRKLVIKKDGIISLDNNIQRKNIIN